MIITPSLFFLSLFYISVSFKTYRSYRKAGLLSDLEHAKKYFHYIVFWPAYTNPFEVIAEKIFQKYGDKGHIYSGWKGLKNFYADLTKGKDRYSDYKHYSFVCEVFKFEDPIFEKINYIEIKISEKGDSFLLNCLFIESATQTSNDFSNYELDDCSPMTQIQLNDELKKCNISDQEIEKILKTVST